jgi:hypothetical protein
MVIAFFAMTSAVQARNTDYRSPKHAEGATTVNVDEAKWLFDEGVVFIDVRNSRFFSRRHVPGAIHLDMKNVFSREALAAVARKDQPIVIYSSGIKCGRAHRASVQCRPFPGDMKKSIISGAASLTGRMYISRWSQENSSSPADIELERAWCITNPTMQTSG